MDCITFSLPSWNTPLPSDTIMRSCLTDKFLQELLLHLVKSCLDRSSKATKLISFCSNVNWFCIFCPALCDHWTPRENYLRRFPKHEHTKQPNLQQGQGIIFFMLSLYPGMKSHCSLAALVGSKMNLSYTQG